jgi:molybdenum cofactor synthesis domain-containing protein
VAAVGPQKTPRGEVPRMHPDRDGPLRVELISVGRELLRGETPDTNGPRLARVLAERGALVHRITVVDDNARAISAVVREALDRQPHLVVLSGGLGPGRDDVTLEGLAEAVQRPLTLNRRVKQMVEVAYHRLHDRGVVRSEAMTAEREKLCSIPVGSEPIANETGVAPGVLLTLPGGAGVLALPGQPKEMRSVFDAALGSIEALVPRRHRAMREVEAPTADESSLQPLLDKLAKEYPMVRIRSDHPGFQKKGGQVKLSLEATSADRDEAESAVDCAVRRLLALAAGVR